MKWLYWVGILMLVPGLLWAQAIDENCTQSGASACIDWDRGVVIAEGIGAPSSMAKNPAVANASAVRAARLDAARNILEMIKGINLDSQTTMQDAMIASDVVRTRVQGHLHGLRPVSEPRYFSDGTVKVRLEARLLKTIPQELAFRQEQAQPPPQPPVEVMPPQSQGDSMPAEGSEVAESGIDTSKIYTGLIVDARETGLQPAMSPKILDEAGNEVYGSAYVERDWVTKHGMAGYLKNLDKAEHNDRVKGTPLTIKALKADGKNNTNLVISNQDANALREIAQKLTFLREARVVMVLN